MNGTVILKFLAVRMKYRKFLAIYASPNRYFSENMIVQWLGAPDFMISCNSESKRQERTQSTKREKKSLFVLPYFACMVTFQNILKLVSNFFLTSDVLFYILKFLIMRKKGEKFLTFNGRGGRFQKKKVLPTDLFLISCSE